MSVFNDTLDLSLQINEILRYRGPKFNRAIYTDAEFAHWRKCEDGIKNNPDIIMFKEFIEKTVPQYSSERYSNILRQDTAASLGLDLKDDTLFSFEDVIKRLGYYDWSEVLYYIQPIIEHFPASKANHAVSIILHDVLFQFMEELDRQCLDIRADLLTPKVFIEAPHPSQLVDCPKPIPNKHPAFYLGAYLLKNAGRYFIIESCTRKKGTNQQKTEDFMCSKYGKKTGSGFKRSEATFTILELKTEKDFNKYLSKYLKTVDASNLRFKKDPNNFPYEPFRTVEQNYIIQNFIANPYGLNIPVENFNEQSQATWALIADSRIPLHGTLYLPREIGWLYKHFITIQVMRLRQTQINKLNWFRKTYFLLPPERRFLFLK